MNEQDFFSIFEDAEPGDLLVEKNFPDENETHLFYIFLDKPVNRKFNWSDRTAFDALEYCSFVFDQSMGIKRKIFFSPYEGCEFQLIKCQKNIK